MSDDCQLLLGDCLVRMGEIADGSVDLIAADLPFGVTECRWDEIIPFEPMWAHFKRVLKPHRAIVLTASQPFTSMLVMSNRESFKYCWVWYKTRPGDVFNAKNKPLRYHEDVCVFSEGTTANCSDRRMPYYPQGLGPGRDRLPAKQKWPSEGNYNHRPSRPESYANQASHYPGSVLWFPSETKPIHTTQKPVALFEYLIRTYSNQGETVLDPTFGSGTTGLACINTGRRFIGIERDPAYFEIARKRLVTAQRPLIAV